MLKRIAYISYESGFLSIHTHEIIANFIKQGIKVDLFLPRSVRLNAALHEDCNIEKIPVIFNSTLLATVSYQIILIIYILIRLGKPSKPDMIYARQNFLGILPIFWARTFKIPYFAEVNGITKKRQHRPISIKRSLKTYLEQLCLKFADIIITPSETLKKAIIERYQISSDKIYAVPNGTNTELFVPQKRRKIKHEVLGIDENDFVIGFVGSLGEWQGIEVFKGAIKILIADPEMEAAKFLIVGDYIKDANLSKMKAGFGDGQKDITAFISKNCFEGKVLGQGYVSYEASADYMNACDILVAPYTSAAVIQGGGSPIKLYAYLGCGKPVVISDLGEFTDSLMLKKYQAAILIPPDDDQALGSAIIKLKCNSDLRKSLGNRGRNFVLEKRKWFHTCTKIKSIYAHKL